MVRRVATAVLLAMMLGACTPAQRAVFMDWVDNQPSTPNCTAAHHEWPCHPHGDNEPTVRR